MTSSGFQKDGYELIRHGLKVSAKMTKTWLEFSARSSKGQPIDVMKPWMDPLTWEKDLDELQKSLFSIPLFAAPLFEGMEGAIEFSKEWQKHYSQLIGSAASSSSLDPAGPAMRKRAEI